MPTAVYQILKLSDGEPISIYEHRTSLGYDGAYWTKDRNTTKYWYISPPSHLELIKLSEALRLPINSFESVLVQQGYSYDPE